jgi:uncharacterized protein with von Willebrand factor type A (vWA) domain
MDNQNPVLIDNGGGQLLANLLHFARLLRQLSIPVSSNQVVGLAQGLILVDITSKNDFYNASRAFLLQDISKQDQFDLAFDMFWSNYIKVILELPGNRREIFHREAIEKETESLSNNNISGFLDTNPVSIDESIPEDQSKVRIKSVYSAYEMLREKDFRHLTDEEFRKAKTVIRKMAWLAARKRSRRKFHAPKKTKFLDFRRSIRNNLIVDGELVDLEWRRNKYKPRSLIVLCDISGSMEKYSQIFLFFLYAMVQETRRIETFVFGTRLTRLTLQLRKQDTDTVLGDLSSTIKDWSGGTRIGDSIKEFNYHWSRRVGCQGSIVMVISDGWDRGNYELLDREIGRLSRTAHSLIWLNPLAESRDYQPLVKGIQTILPYVDVFYPVANLKNLEHLALYIESIR